MVLRNWTAPVNGNWSERLNWTGQEIPQNGDDVVISFANDNITTTLSTTFTLNNFTTDEDFQISGSSSSGFLQVNGVGLLNAKTTLSAAGLLGNFINNGNISIIGSINSGLASRFDSQGNIIPGTFNNQGTIAQTANFSLSNATINNQSGATYNFQSGVISGSSGGNDFFNNSGILLKSTNGTAAMNVFFRNQSGGLIDWIDFNW